MHKRIVCIICHTDEAKIFPQKHAQGLNDLGMELREIMGKNIDNMYSRGFQLDMK